MTVAVNANHPYTPAFKAGDTVYVSGALGVDVDYQPVAGRDDALDAAVERMTERLATAGAALDDVVKLTYYVTDLSLREEANRQLERIFAAPRPARTFLEVSALPYGATVEIDAVAYVGDRG
ncbi:RidA family protein [Gordonia humi]|uniref:Enamine deaminase RidA (YjgF/YER057c/UK114 family) n=1 Tax=Gordonia humi TaxID=686429 RepID=A0A840ENB7_9ACTN|nr:RidA family protein [Gordonia humi]MBB4134295.1 enamine deaminase RidA (YjgF/YER057c/UK114 family) [Gordonia humi]